MNKCLWCDDPTDEKLCPSCRKAHDHPPYHCQIDPKHLPTLGPCCATCTHMEEQAARRAAEDAPILASLKAIRKNLIADWHTPWPGVNFGKALFGNMLNGAIKGLEWNRITPQEDP